MSVASEKMSASQLTPAINVESDVQDVGLLEEAVEDTLNDLFPVLLHKDLGGSAGDEPHLGYRMSDLSLCQLVLIRHLERESSEHTKDPKVCEEYNRKALQKTWHDIAPARFKDFPASTGPPQASSDPSAKAPLTPYVLLSPEAILLGKRLASSSPEVQCAKKSKNSPDPEQTGDQAEHTPTTTLSRTEKKLLRSQAHRRTRYAVENTQVFQAQELNLGHLRISSTGWKGIDATKCQRDPLTKLLRQKERSLFLVLANFIQIPYDVSSPNAQRATRILDSHMRLCIYRSKRSKWIMEVLDELGEAARVFVEATSVTKLARDQHSRGRHFFMIVGFDRNNKAVPSMSAWQAKEAHQRALAVLFESLAMQRINEYVSALVKEHFPRIAERMEASVKINCEKYSQHGLKSNHAYGLFWNFCLNAPVAEEGIRNVFCLPHTDSKNGAILVCAVFVYYYGTRRGTPDERIWLVFWEAGLIIQVPVGVVIIYPSALFLHFNVDIEDILVVTAGGNLPTPDTSVPFGQDNDMAGGRASMVWFTQATMLQSAELPTDTVKEMKDLEAEALTRGAKLSCSSTYNAQSALAAGMFPFNAEA